MVVTDDYPAFFLARMLRRVTKRLPKKCELIDSNGIFPMAGTEKCFARAYDFRRFLQKNLRPHLNVLPDADPMPSSETVGSVTLDDSICERWPELTRPPSEISLKNFPIDHSVQPVTIPGGSHAAEECLKRFSLEEEETR